MHLKAYEAVTRKLGVVEQVWLSGEFARGNDSESIELLLVGTVIDKDYLEQLRVKAASLVSRSIRLTLFTPDAFTKLKEHVTPTDMFLLWESPHPG